MTMVTLEGRIRQLLVLPPDDAVSQLMILIREREAKARSFVPQHTQQMHRQRVKEKQLLQTYA